MRAKQTGLFKYYDMDATHKRYGRTQHGGLGAKNHRKLERPLSTKKWIHLVLKSDKAVGQLSFLKPANQTYVRRLLQEKALKFGVKIADYANVGNHLHLKIRITSRESFKNFLKSVTAQIARKITGACKGKPFGRFWQGLAFTRILTSRLEELNLKGYIEANRREAAHSQVAREKFLKKFNQWVYKERLQSKTLDNYSTA